MEHTEALTPERLLTPSEVTDVLFDAKTKLAQVADLFRFHNERGIPLSEQEVKKCWKAVVAFCQESIDVLELLWTGLGGRPGAELHLKGDGEAVKDKDREIIQYLESKLFAIESFCAAEPAQGFCSDLSRKACLDLLISFVDAASSATARIGTVLGVAALLGDRLVGEKIIIPMTSTCKYRIERPSVQ